MMNKHVGDLAEFCFLYWVDFPLRKQNLDVRPIDFYERLLYYVVLLTVPEYYATVPSVRVPYYDWTANECVRQTMLVGGGDGKRNYFHGH